MGECIGKCLNNNTVYTGLRPTHFCKIFTLEVVKTRLKICLDIVSDTFIKSFISQDSIGNIVDNYLVYYLL